MACISAAMKQRADSAVIYVDVTGALIAGMFIDRVPGSVLFGEVHGGVGMLHEEFFSTAMLRILNNADTDSDIYDVAFDGERSIERSSDLFGNFF